MESTTLDPRFVRVLKIKKRHWEWWQEVLIEIENIKENYDRNSRQAEFQQLLAELPFFSGCKRRKYLLKKQAIMCNLKPLKQ